MCRFFLVLLLGTTASAHAERFSGEGQIRPPDPSSENGRFSLNADLKPAEAVSANGRFSFQAALKPDSKTLAALCGDDDLFRNGFEDIKRFL
jgi:hypothetical protein